MNSSDAENPDKNPVVMLPIAPIIATGIAAIILIILMIPGFLVYPEDVPETSQLTLDKVEQANDVLRERVEALKEALDVGVCVADGEFKPLDSGLNDSVLGLLPSPPLSQLKPHSEATNHLPSFSGSMGDLIDNVTTFIRVTTTQGYGFGSGVFVAPDLVLTNAHVVEGATNDILIYNALSGSYRSQIIAAGSSNDVDLALLKVLNPADDQAFLSLSTSEVGQSVTAAGYPWIVVSGDSSFVGWVQDPSQTDPQKKPFRDTQILSLVQTEANVETLYHTAAIDKGNSGGPLVDKCGFLVGINTGAKSRDEEGAVPLFNIAIGQKTIQEFFKVNNLALPVVATQSCDVL